MKKELKGFIVGLIISTIGITSVFATNGIKSAQFNSNQVIFNGNTLDLSSQPMISIIKDGEDNASNYMPVRAILEQMGYYVDWDSTNNAIIINNEVPQMAITETKVIENSENVNKANYVFTLSDDDIKNAIEECNKGITYLLNTVDKKYAVNVKSGEKVISNYTEIKVLTPYLYITRNAAIESASYKSYSFELAKDFYKRNENDKKVSLDITIPETSFDKSSTTSIGIFQNDAKIKNVKISGLDGLPDTTKRSNFRYQRYVTVIFSQNDFDYTKPLLLKINFAGTFEVVYELNLSNYK